MTAAINQVKVLHGITPQCIPYDELFAANQPVLLKGLVKDWPLVKTAQNTPQHVMSQLEKNYSGRPMLVYKGLPQIKARFGYNEACTGFNFDTQRSTIPQVFNTIREQLSQDEHEYLYINSLKFDDGFPALSSAHQLSFEHEEFENNVPVAKIWLGTESIAAAHFDQPKNIACCVLGKRRFTLFAPEQIHNLYPGPLTPTPGGQVITMADLNEPDFERFPKLQQALDSAYIVELEPGDALYYPNMWWHQVQAYDRFNVMVNFWWMTAQPHMGNPMDLLMHGMMNLRDRPATEKEAWKVLFDYYVFGDPETVREHLPPLSHGTFAAMDELSARRLRAMLLNNLNR
jgi:hypothetical protein